MSYATPVNSEISNAPTPEHLTSYEMAVLSTLFDPEDIFKVLDLANQWGYQQELLHSVWQELHRHRSSGFPEPHN